MNVSEKCLLCESRVQYFPFQGKHLPLYGGEHHVYQLQQKEQYSPNNVCVYHQHECTV